MAVELTPTALLTIITPATVAPSPIVEPTTLSLGSSEWIGRGKIAAAAFPTGARQVVVAWGSGVSLHEVATGAELWFQPVPTNLIAFAAHPQGDVFAAALADGSLLVFDASGNLILRHENTGRRVYWGDLGWSPSDDNILAFQFRGPSRSDPIHLLDVESGQVSQVPGSWAAEGAQPALTWSPDGAAITVAGLGEDCPRFVEVVTGEEILRLGDAEGCFAAYPVFLPGGERLAAVGSDGRPVLLRYPDGARLRTFDAASGNILGRLLEFPAAGGPLFVDPVGLWVAARGGYEPCYCGNPQDQPLHPMVVWDAASGRVQAALPPDAGLLGQVRQLAAAFDGGSMLALYESGEITRWNFSKPQAGEEVLARLHVHPSSGDAPVWSANGSRLAISGRYGGVDVYETNGGRLARSFAEPLQAPALSADGSLVALFDPEQGIEVVFDIHSGRELHRMPASPTLMGAAFSPDGRFLAYGAEEGARAAKPAAVFDLSSGQTTLLDASAPGLSLARLVWSPDGQSLTTMFGNASSDESGLIVLWKRRAGGAFEHVYQAANAQAAYTTANLILTAFNPSGSLAAVQSMPQNEAGQAALVVFDLQAEKVARTFARYRAGAWVHDDELLAAEVEYDLHLARLRVSDGQIVTGSGRAAGDSAFAPGGVFVAQLAVPPGRGVVVRYWSTGAVAAEAQVEALNLIGISWSPDGRWLAALGDDGTLRIWIVQF